MADLKLHKVTVFPSSVTAGHVYFVSTSGADDGQLYLATTTATGQTAASHSALVGFTGVRKASYADSVLTIVNEDGTSINIDHQSFVTAVQTWVSQNYVNLTGEQTISGRKTFTGGIKIGDLLVEKSGSAVKFNSDVIATGAISSQSDNPSADNVGSGFDAEQMWEELETVDETKKIDVSHIPTIGNDRLDNDSMSIAGKDVALGGSVSAQEIGAAIKNLDSVFAPLDANKNIPLEYLPDAILGQMLYGGTLGASAVATLTTNAKNKLGTTSNTITLTNNTTAITGYKDNEGIYYIVGTAQSFAGVSFGVGDWLVSTGSGWKKIDNTDAVTSVAGKTGAVTLTKSDVGLGNVDNTSDANKPISTAQAAKNTELANATAAVASNLATEVANRQSAIAQEVADRNTAIANKINALDSETDAGSGKYLQKVVIENGKINDSKSTKVAVPTKLKNPYAVTIKAKGVNKTYDGSAAVEVEITDIDGNAATATKAESVAWASWNI